MSLPLLYLDIRGVERDDGTRVQAVRIACDSEVYELDATRHQTLTISAFDDVFNDSMGSTSARSDLSRFLGIPLSARKIRLESFRSLQWRNTGAAVLFRNCDIGSTLDPAREPFGSIPDFWSINTGPIVAARLDKKPLHPLHMAAISAFISRELGRLFQECKEAEQAWRDQYQYDMAITYDQSHFERYHHHEHTTDTSSTAATSSSTTTTTAPTTTTTTTNAATADEPGHDLFDSALWHIFERRRRVLAAATPQRFESFFQQYKAQRVRGRPELMAPRTELTSRQRRELQSVERDEIEPRPEWVDVMSPLCV